MQNLVIVAAPDTQTPIGSCGLPKSARTYGEREEGRTEPWRAPLVLPLASGNVHFWDEILVLDWWPHILGLVERRQFQAFWGQIPVRD